MTAAITMTQVHTQPSTTYTHEQLILTNIRVLHRIYCQHDSSAIDINIDELGEDEYKLAKSTLIELIEYEQNRVAPKDYRLYYQAEGAQHSYHRTFANLEAAKHMLVAYQMSKDVSRTRLMNPVTSEVIYDWTRGKGRTI